MTIKEIHQMAEDAWVPCDGCTESDKYFWVNGYVSAVMRHTQYIDHEEQIRLMQEFADKVKSGQQNLDLEFLNIINEHFNDLV
jgi:hypothetical protein